MNLNHQCNVLSLVPASLYPCHWVICFRSDSGLSHVTHFGQCFNSNHEAELKTGLPSLAACEQTQASLRENERYSLGQQPTNQ